ncbi:S8 family serine peptidase [Microcystis wesenbergii FACHB-1317]|uniref:S8 family serine peptidase n=1 Tax=Microcystis TaxID=1125 RepID=UPI001680369E|nr:MULTISPECIES: S8 family serine peptidase [Microcystis]MBD2288176.1 S8 family serine peptidase [Microcystis wesenbergii FACHB-1317]UZO77745.1 S8 family serine peptidase [Microcystis aeruginosa str. Chao 1910]
MSGQASFPIPRTASNEETTGRYIVTFQDGATPEGIAALRDVAGISALPDARDFADSAMDSSELDAAGGGTFPTLGVAVVSMDDLALSGVMNIAGGGSAILAIEPERIYYAIEEGLSSEYLKGYRDAVNHLYEQSKAEQELGDKELAALAFRDDAQSTWGLKATKVINSCGGGRGINVAVLDTGMDLNHPDFFGRSIQSQSFVPGEAVQDGQGHGTHCIGTACGFKDVNGRRYGVAYEATIYAGKVLSNAGSGSQSWILAGMEWAIASRCAVISMSLGNTVSTPSTAYETIGRRALQNGCLIIAAAGNHRPGTVGQPANSPSIMAVAAIDSNLRLASFSCGSGTAQGANVDIAGPGVAIYSSVPMPRRYDVFNGTSMATPHVAGIAALHAQASGVRGAQLWQLLTSKALRLSIPTVDVGSGLVQAP